MPRQTRIAALLLFALAACSKEKASATDAGLPYTVSAKAEAGQRRIDLATQEGFHVNAEYPVSYQYADAGRVPLKDAMEKTPCLKAPEDACAAVMRVADAPGTLAFSVCSKEACLIEKVPLP